MKTELLKLLSYKGLFPSKDFNEYEYSLYLQYASAGELERDILTEETYRMIITHISPSQHWKYL